MLNSFPHGPLVHFSVLYSIRPRGVLTREDFAGLSPCVASVCEQTLQEGSGGLEGVQGLTNKGNSIDDQKKKKRNEIRTVEIKHTNLRVELLRVRAHKGIVRHRLI
jgi:hypothetical protein